MIPDTEPSPFIVMLNEVAATTGVHPELILAAFVRAVSS